MILVRLRVGDGDGVPLDFVLCDDGAWRTQKQQEAERQFSVRRMSGRRME